MTDNPDLKRRQLLLRLGLATTAAYSAPVLLALNPARASDSFSGPSAASAPSYGSDTSVHPRRVQAQRQWAPPPELLVGVQNRSDFDRLSADGFSLLGAERIELLGLWVGRFALPGGMSMQSAQLRAASLLPLARIENNGLYRTSEMLCREGECAAFSLIGWPQPDPCSAAPVIGMIDTALNADHDAFAGRNVRAVGLDMGERDAAGPTHGTAVAALLIGRSGSRTPGLLPNAQLIAVEAFHRDPLGDAADAFALVRGLDILAREAVSVINLSLAGPENAFLEDAVKAVIAGGVSVVAAAGNAGPRADPLYPAAYDGVIAVTAVDRNGRVYRQASAGDHVMLAAPGVGLWTAASVSGGRLRSGTSYAAPFVTAALAVRLAENPDDGPEGAVAALLSNAEDLGDGGFDPLYGWGLVRADDICIVST